jgi:hypothetical protein
MLGLWERFRPYVTIIYNHLLNLIAFELGTPFRVYSSFLYTIHLSILQFILK